MPSATGASRSPSRRARKTCETYLALWFLLPIAFFSLSQSKLPGYILPAIPAGTILLADFVLRREQEGDKPRLWLAVTHAVLCAAMPVAALIVPFKLLHVDVSKPAMIVAAALAIITVLTLLVSLRAQGYRLLRFTTLVPLLITFALVLRGTAPIIDVLQSARPVQLALSETAIGEIPSVAVYDVPRSVEYGLEFYRNQKISSYERNEIPDGDHLVVAAAGSQSRAGISPERPPRDTSRRLRAAAPRLLRRLGRRLRTAKAVVFSVVPLFD